MKNIATLVGIAGPLIIRRLQAAEATTTARFAAPDVASALPAGTAGGIGQVTVALLLVLAAVFAVAVLIKRLRAVTGAGVNGIEVLAQTSLGSKERAVIVRVGDTRLLLGVASGQVSLLQTLPEVLNSGAPASSDNSQRSSFAALLKKSLGR